MSELCTRRNQCSGLIKLTNVITGWLWWRLYPRPRAFFRAARIMVSNFLVVSFTRLGIDSGRRHSYVPQWSRKALAALFWSSYSEFRLPQVYTNIPASGDAVRWNITRHTVITLSIQTEIRYDWLAYEITACRTTTNKVTAYLWQLKITEFN